MRTADRGKDTSGESGGAFHPGIDAIGAGVIVHDHTGALVSANAAASAILGFDPTGKTTATPYWRLAEDAETDGPDRPAPRLPAGHVPGGTVSVRTATGELRHLKVTAHTAPVVPDGPPGVVVTFVDVTAEWSQCRRTTEAQTELRRAQRELLAYNMALDHHAIVAVTDLSGRMTYVNDLFCRTSQYAREELIGQRHSIVNSGHHPRRFFVELWKTIVRGDSWHGEICNRAKGGDIYWVDTTVVPLRDDRGKVDGFVSIRYDITQRKLAEVALDAENKRREDAETLLRDVIDSIPDGVAAYGAEDRLVVFNEAYRAYYDLSAPAIREGAKFEDIVRFGLKHGQFAADDKASANPEKWLRARLRAHRNPGRISLHHLSNGRWLQVHERRSPSGNIVGVRTDITELKRAEDVIKTQAERDPLTGLFNRHVLMDRLKGVFARDKAGNARQGALVLVDLDHFKDINDTLGHDAGDELLQVLSERFVSALRKSDTVARLGGDEFAIILPDLVNEGDANRLIKRVMRRLKRPVKVGQRTINPGFSLGIAFYPRDGRTPKELLKNADIALYQAKGRGRGNWCFFKSRLRARVEQRHELADALRRAVEGNRITVALQPQTMISGGTHTGFEALARWQHAGRPVAPDEFISIAEETGQIVPLGHAVTDKALAAFADLRSRGLAPGHVAINVTAAQLKQEGFADTLRWLLDRHGVGPRELEIEVTETVLLDRSADLIARSLGELSRMGIRIALDDFGTGYASLAHLKRFKIDRLKIDKSFVADLMSDPEDAIIVRTVITLAHSLGMDVVAEGIETIEQLAYLRQHGCDVGQGYLFGRPMTPEDARGYLRERHVDPERRAG